MSLNPSAPTIVGLEVFALCTRGLSISKDRQRAALWTPGAKTGDDLMLKMGNTFDDPVLAVEIVPVASLAPGATVTSTYRPNADGTVSGVVHAGGGAVAPFYVDVDEAVLDVADYTLLQTTNAYALFEYAAAAFTGRPFSVTLHAVVEALATGVVVIPRLSIAGIVYDGAASALDVAQTTFTYTWDFNPATNAPWTAADIAALDSGSYLGFANASASTNSVRVYEEWVTVDGAAADNRVAVGYFSPVDGWNTVSMTTPAGADTWSLAAATAYAIILSNPAGVGASSWQAIDAGVAHPEVTSASVSFDTRSVPLALGDTDTAAPAFAVLDTTGAALTGQPYGAITDLTVSAGRTVEQEITLPNTASRGGFKFVACLESIVTTADLLVKLKRRSDNTQIGGTLTVTADDVRANPRLLQVLALPTPTAAAGSAAQHYVEFSTTGESGAGWIIPALDVDGPAAVQMLTTNQQGLETDTTGWAAGASATISQSATYAHGGTKSLRLESSAGTGTRTATTPTGVSGFAVVPGQLLSASAYGRVNAAIAALTGRLKIVWYTAAGASISTTTGSNVTLPNTAFAALAAAGIAPATAAFAAVVVEVDALANGGSNYAYFDDVSALRGSALQALTFNGATDVATVAGVDDPDLDVPVLVWTAIASPANQTAVAA